MSILTESGDGVYLYHGHEFTRLPLDPRMRPVLAAMYRGAAVNADRSGAAETAAAFREAAAIQEGA